MRGFRFQLPRRVGQHAREKALVPRVISRYLKAKCQIKCKSPIFEMKVKVRRQGAPQATNAMSTNIKYYYHLFIQFVQLIRLVTASELISMQFNYCTRQHAIYIMQMFVAKGLVLNRGPHIVIPTQIKCSLNLVIPMVILEIPHPVHTFNPEFPSHLSLESRIPACTKGICLKDKDKDKDKANPGSRKTQAIGDPHMSPGDWPGVVVPGLSRLCFHCNHIHCLYGLLCNLQP